MQEIDGHGGGKAHGSLGIVEACEEVEQYAESPEMSGSDGTAYRGLVSRLNYLDLDSPIMLFSAKNVAVESAPPPREADWLKLNRVARYLVGFHQDHPAVRVAGGSGPLAHVHVQ